MLTIFSCPKPFYGHTEVIQRNAIKSWTMLPSSPEIIILGDEEGTKDVCKEYNIRHIPEVQRNKYDTPLMSSIFSQAEKYASNRFMCYINADIILMSEFIIAIQRVIQQTPECLIVGRRWDLDVNKTIDFSNNWEDKMKSIARLKGELHAYSGIDYFIFPKGLITMLPFAIGRIMWDNWFIYKCRSLKIPVIDISPTTTIIHQNHDHKYNNRYGDYRKGNEAKQNMILAGGYGCAFTVLNASHKLTKKGLKRNLSFKRFYWELNRIIRRRFKTFFK